MAIPSDIPSSSSGDKKYKSDLYTNRKLIDHLNNNSKNYIDVGDLMRGLVSHAEKNKGLPRQYLINMNSYISKLKISIGYTAGLFGNFTNEMLPCVMRNVSENIEEYLEYNSKNSTKRLKTYAIITSPFDFSKNTNIYAIYQGSTPIFEFDFYNDSNRNILENYPLMGKNNEPLNLDKLKGKIWDEVQKNR